MDFYRDIGFLVFGSRLRRLSEQFLNDVNRIYRYHKIDFDAAWFPVFYLLSQKEEVSIKNISDASGTSHSAASQMVTSLQQKGLIKSVVSKKDARHKVITFTSKGEKLLQKIKPVWEALQKAMEALVTEDAKSKKILEALTATEQSLEKKSLYDRIEQHL